MFWSHWSRCHQRRRLPGYCFYIILDIDKTFTAGRRNSLTAVKDHFLYKRILKMPYTNFSNGLTSLGIPAGVGGALVAAGNIFFVSSIAGADANSGTEPSARYPLATIAHALTLCTPNNGDIIYCMPGHAETITGAAGIALNVAGVSLIGIGNGFLRPTITFTTATNAQMTVTAANQLIQNFNFVGDFAALAAMISVTAAGVSFQSCNFYAQI